MTSGAQIWLPKGASHKKALQREIDSRLRKGATPAQMMEFAFADLSQSRLPVLMQRAIYSTLRFEPRPRGMK